MNLEQRLLVFNSILVLLEDLCRVVLKHLFSCCLFIVVCVYVIRWMNEKCLVETRT